jgi:PAS domain S-box-containing protein
MRRAPKPAVKRRKKAVDRLDLVMGAVNEGVYDYDIARDEIYYSPRIYEVLDVPPAKLKTAADWRKLVHPDDLEAYLAAFVAHVKGQVPRFEIDHRYRARKGWRWARQHGMASRDARGRAIRIVGSIGDITELKLAEERLRASEERYTLATQAATEGIYEWNLETGTLYLSLRARAFFAVSGERLTPAAWNSRVHGEDFQGYRDAVAAYLKGKTSTFEHEYRIRSSDGYSWVVDRAVAVRNAEGRVTRMVGALSDVTQRKRAELELRRARDEATEALQYQSASSEVLRIVSSSMTNAQPVFQAILDAAMGMFENFDATVWELRGDDLVVLARGGRTLSAGLTPVVRILPGSPHATVVHERRAVSIDDVTKATGYAPETLQALVARGRRAMIMIPLVRDGNAIGAISVSRTEPYAFSQKQVALLENFADQAVIAIENARLFRELEARNTDLSEALEQQTATSEILKVISSSPTDVYPVFDTILRNAVRLTSAEIAAVFRFDGERVHLTATHNWSEEALDYFARVYPSPPSPSLLSGRTILSKSVVRIPDAAADPHYDPSSTATGHWRRMLGVPMLREGNPLGALVVTWREPGDTPQHQVDLLQTFADQAAIAIENVRLFKELEARNRDLGESLEQQTATSEILKVISRTTFDLQPVLEIVLSNARRLCGADRGFIFRPNEDGDYVPMAFALSDGIAAPADATRAVFDRAPIRLDRGSATGRAVLDGVTIHIADVLADPEYSRRDIAEAGNYRSILSVPMLRDGAAIGVLTLSRSGEVRPFSDKQIELVRVFADQAVIAIENVRLFREIQDKTRQLEVANQHKSEFLANMSHELRTPLNAVIGFSEVLMERMFGEVNEKQAEYLKDIHESGRHLLSLINDILDLSKIEAGRMELELASFHLPTALSNAMTLIRERAQRHGIQLGQEIDERLAGFVADERKVKQVLLNLLSNAVKFTPEGGRVDVAANLGGDHVEITVRDSGIGISAEDQAKLFDAFTQVGSDSARKAEGTGLGLALTKKFVELHGGRIRVESAPGKGSTFAFTLPVRS